MRGGGVTSNLLSRESKQRVAWNFSPFVLFFDSEKTGGNLTCGPPNNMVLSYDYAKQKRRRQRTNVHPLLAVSIAMQRH